MMKRQLSKVHGHTISELERVLKDSCDLFDNEVHLEQEALGGWSNINIRGQYDEGSFVLKLPWTIFKRDADYYQQLNDISQFYGKLGITTSPLAMGLLSDKMQTPFIIFEYIEGVVHNSLVDFSEQDILLLKDCLNILYREKPPGLILYESPSAFLDATHSTIASHEGLSMCSRDVTLLNTSFSDMFSEVQTYVDSLGSWTTTVMHGDLWVPNIVLQSERAVLLDFEDCAYGNRFYDLAFLLETPISPSIDLLSRLIDPDEETIVSSYRPLALSYIIIWSIERLLSMEAGLVEPNLNTRESRSDVIGYTRSKISRLKDLL